ncbi:MAG TPA: thioredoxin domain-containing protein, partial [Thiobacillus sp.]|nr:thioredoxin domain-containing protein [Thiobacillus sp.]
TRTARVWQLFMAGVWQEADTLHGGLGQVSKFPMAPQLHALLERQTQQPDARLAAFLRLTFDQMAARGLRDHVGGGFFRYTTDPEWDTPHFEKMLYDNAHLAVLYLRAATVLRQPRYREIARSTLDFMEAELLDASGGLYSSTSAVDAAGREGATYLWEPDELKRRLSPEAYAAARRVWRLDVPRSFDDGYLPAEYRTPTADERRLLADAARTLRPLRQARSLPKDDKLNAGLNGLALSAFSQAIPLDPAYRPRADRLQRFLLTRLVRDGRLLKAMARGQMLPQAELEDYAYVVQGLLDHAEATGNGQSRARARQLAHTAWKLFWSEKGWKHEAQPLLATLQAEPALADGALYSPSDVLILASLRLQEPALQRLARNAAGWRLPAMEQDAYAYPTRLRVLTQVQPDA